MSKNIKYTPPIMYMLINTDNKTKNQLKQEIIDRVDEAIEDRLKLVKDELSKENYRTVARKLAEERREIIKQFVFQIENMESINKSMEIQKEVENVI